MCHSKAASTLWLRAKPWVAALPVAMLMGSGAYAASLGHSRIVSEPGQALRMDVPVYELSVDDLRTFAVSVAPAAAWKQAGLTPPVALSSLHVQIVRGTVAGSRVVRFSSSQIFDGSVADLLLEVHTATGQQQYQVSVLATSPHHMATGGAAGHGAVASAGADARQVRTGRRRQTSLPVRRGDTLFAIARAHAVPGVTVYQMLVALLRANPQAFIDRNMNLVKAGATLHVPDMASLTAISDREARRIFQEQALAFAQYRQRLAARKSVRVQAGPANKGTVSQETSAPPVAVTQSGDQVKLSSGDASAADARADNRVATRNGIADSQQRVTQLEENVQHINQALQGQGEAAKDAVVGAARGLGKSISDAASVVAGVAGNPAAGQIGSASAAEQAGGLPGGQGSGGVAPTRGAATKNSIAADSVAGNGVSGAATGHSTSNAATGNSTSSAATGLVPVINGAGNATTGNSASGTTAGNSASGTATGKSISNTTAGHSASNATTDNGASNVATGLVPVIKGAGNTTTGNISSGTTTSNSTSGTATSNSTSGTTTSNSTSGTATSNSTSGTATSNNAVGATAAGNVPAAAAGTTSDAAQSAASAGKQALNKEGQSVSWFQEHLLGIITALLTLLVLVIAWLLRRANIARDDDSDDRASTITEAMVKEKLEQINLDLSERPSDEPSAAKS